MSGGFFRGTSADQDTRFSNKQAKLLKSQKFAAELENLVDMTKVKMDVMKPWIAKRVTELIGFEDEVLINFIYGLLEGKAVNGKQVQIQLTGFMERNTGKFMKELWALLLSAQQNVSGVPQQFLDAKEEESKKKKAEADRIANEIRMKNEKDKKELGQEKTKMDDDGGMSREKRAMLELDLKHDPVRTTDHKKNGSRGRSRGSLSSESASGSPTPRRKNSMSPSKSPNSRSHSGGRQRSRKITRATPSRSRSISSERPRRSSPRRSVTPCRKYDIRRSRSPSGRRSFYSKRGSVSPKRRRSPSPKSYRVRPTLRYRSRSPLRRKSRSPMRRRSRSPLRYRSRSPLRRRSPSPGRRRSPSPLRRRSPSPVGRRSPSPVRGRSPSPPRRRSPSPVCRRSPSPLRPRPASQRHRSPAPVRRPYRQTSSSPHKRSASPVRHRASMHDQRRPSPVLRRSSSPQYSSSQSPIRRSSLSPKRRGPPRRVARSPPQSPGQRTRSHDEYSPARQASLKERSELLPKSHNGSKAVEHKPTVSLRSPQRDMLEQNDLRRKERDSSISIQKAPFGAEGPRDKSHVGGGSPRGSPYQKREGRIPPENRSSLPKAAGLKPHHESSGANTDDEEKFSRREIGEPKFKSLGKAAPAPVRPKDSLDSAVTRGLAQSRKTHLTNSDRQPDKVDNMEYRDLKELPINKESGLSGKGKDSHVDRDRGLGGKGRESHVDRDRANNKNRAQSDDRRGGNRLPEVDTLPELSRKSDQNGSTELPSKKIDDHRIKVKEKRKHKKLDTREADSDDYSSNDSHGERWEAKKRRKEEKKLKKQERRQRREERHLRKEGRREEKLKSKAVDPGSSSSNSEGGHSVDNRVRRQDTRTSDVLEAESEKKRLEIELREKALESLRAKKGIGH